jgi:hypothetical protein
MTSQSILGLSSARGTALVSALCALVLQGTACAVATSSSAPMTGPTPDWSAMPPSPDPRVGLAPGDTNAGVASWNMRLVSNTPPSADFVGVTNSDLAFLGNYAIQGNYNGYQVWDISNPVTPTLTTQYLCPASQSDVSVYGNLLFVSGEGQAGRVDCGTQGVPDTVSTERLRGIRVFDATDMANPKYIANVQTCRGSHTHTVVKDPSDDENVYIYVSGSSRVRSPSELPGCSALSPDEDANSALFRIEVIRVPLAAPEQARIVSSPRIFEDLVAPPEHADPPADVAAREARRRAQGRPVEDDDVEDEGPAPGPTQCHDITVYPEIGLAGGACGGYGLLLDISDVVDPKRVYAAADSNFSYWHSATFNNDGSKILFTDEWGGGSQPRCRETDKYEWGADAIFTRDGNDLTFHSYYKMPAAQTTLENCVAHNGSLVPIPGRDVMVQGWYQGGISVFDWTDPDNPKEIAYFDRGPMDSTRLRSAGSWSVYWYNGHLVSSEIARGLDIFELTPSALLSQNEIDAAKTVRFEYFNAQQQPKIVWPSSFAMARAYLDQLQRSSGLALARIAELRDELARAEELSGQERQDALRTLATELDGVVQSTDREKVRTLAGALRDLAAAQR